MGAPDAFILDVDGVLTSGSFLYSINGKEYKEFGPDDADALKSIQSHIKIHFVSADKRGFPISKKRVEDMGFLIDLVSSDGRAQWIDENYGLDTSVYMGDGFFDHLIFQKVAYSIAPANAFFRTKEFADFVTTHVGGDRAIAEAVVHLSEKFSLKD